MQKSEYLTKSSELLEQLAQTDNNSDFLAVSEFLKKLAQVYEYRERNLEKQIERVFNLPH
jgi:hypothetical protein